MRKEIIACDRCGVQITEDVYGVVIRKYDQYGIATGEYHKMDLCLKRAEEPISWALIRNAYHPETDSPHTKTGRKKYSAQS